MRAWVSPVVFSIPPRLAGRCRGRFRAYTVHGSQLFVDPPPCPLPHVSALGFHWLGRLCVFSLWEMSNTHLRALFAE